jgi:tRNA (pseudouridine54-N1)-methyltransferase
MRRFVVIGQRATASADFALDDLPGTSGRLDILLRCVRAALLCSHGIRRNVVVYLVLCGGPRAPRTLRFTGATARFIRPDERSLAILARKVLAGPAHPAGRGFVETRPGIASANGGLDCVLADVGKTALFVLEEGAPDVRDATEVDEPDAVFFLGDHLGLSEADRSRLDVEGARPIGVGPTSLHAEDTVAIVTNEIERRLAAPRPAMAVAVAVARRP